MAKILIIEDEEATRNLYSTILSSEGQKLIQTAKGFEGVSLALKENPDLILLDYRLPDSTGLEVLKLLNGKSKFSTPILMITNYVGDIDRQAVLDAGVEEIMLKYDITPTILLEKVRKYLGDSKNG